MSFKRERRKVVDVEGLEVLDATEGYVGLAVLEDVLPNVNKSTVQGGPLGFVDRTGPGQTERNLATVDSCVTFDLPLVGIHGHCEAIEKLHNRNIPLVLV